VTPARIITTAFLTIAVGVTLAACGSSSTPPESGPTTRSSASAPKANTPTTQDPTPGSPQEDDMRIEIGIGTQQFEATLDDSAASRDLIAQLPLTLDMSDHGGVEKTGPLTSPLSLDGQPDGADPEVGDLGYYAPGNDLVLYYGDQTYFDGIVVLGRMERDAAGRITELEGDVSVSIGVHQ
jgi:hypothetical protein